MRIAVIGAGGHGKVVLDAVLSVQAFGKILSKNRGMGAFGELVVVGVVDDNTELAGTSLFGVPVVGAMDDLDDVEGYVVAIGDNRIREEKYCFYLQAGYEPVTVIHPSAVVSSRAVLGKGTAVLANVAINPDACVGDNVVLYTSCTVDHECRISHHSYVSPGCNVCGRVCVGAGAMLGTGSVVLPGLSIGEWAVVGAGAVVIDDVPDGVTVVGVPARVMSNE